VIEGHRARHGAAPSKEASVMKSVSFAWSALGLVLVAACSSSSSPGSNPAGSPNDFCSGVCNRIHGCDATEDVETCVNSCTNANAVVVPKLRGDVVSAAESCVAQKDCATVLSSTFVKTCVAQAVAADAADEVAQGFCSAWATAETKCGSTLDQAGCLGDVKPYSDTTISEAQDCLGHACTDMGGCVNAAFGWSSSG
jgi:hypothetical protein